ncbi:hypothetical protein [Streptosporangium sp. NPDC051022]|uniref:hypothetical protein n=1 Tax=Streptosporangium sp. NPDC051022 TaxID=3155752 RepID=UPI00344402D5
MNTVQESRTPVPDAPSRHARSVLISVIGLHLVAETSLTPFLPQLFQRLYGIEDPGATGVYLWICRIVGLAALPLWGLAARRWPLHRLVLAGLCGSAVLDLFLGMAPSYAAYTVLSTAVVTTNSALLLAYPAFIAEHDGRAEDGAARDGEWARIAGIRSIVLVFHLSTVVATAVGAGVLALPEPRFGISAFAVLDTALAVLAYRVLGRRAAPGAPGTGPSSTATPTRTSTGTPASGEPAPDAGTGTGVDTGVGGGPVAGARRGRRLPHLVHAALIGIAFDFSVNVARPFFTEFADALGGGSAISAALFFLPSVAALAVLPVVRRCHDVLGPRLLPLALAIGATGLAWQALSSSLAGLAGGRLLFGAGLGLCQVAVELRVFRATGTAGPAFTAVETARSAGLLAAPLTAAAVVSYDLALPIAVAAVVQALAVALTLERARPAPPPTGAPAASPSPTAAPATSPSPTAAPAASLSPTTSEMSPEETHT